MLLILLLVLILVLVLLLILLLLLLLFLLILILVLVLVLILIVILLELGNSQVAARVVVIRIIAECLFIGIDRFRKLLSFESDITEIVGS